MWNRVCEKKQNMEFFFDNEINMKINLLHNGSNALNSLRTS